MSLLLRALRSICEELLQISRVSTDHPSLKPSPLYGARTMTGSQRISTICTTNQPKECMKIQSPGSSSRYDARLTAVPSRCALWSVHLASVRWPGTQHLTWNEDILSRWFGSNMAMQYRGPNLANLSLSRRRNVTVYEARWSLSPTEASAGLKPVLHPTI